MRFFEILMSLVLSHVIETFECWVSLMPKTCHTHSHGSGIQEITPRPRRIKIIKLNINI